MLEKDYSIVIAEKGNFDDIIAINKVFYVGRNPDQNIPLDNSVLRFAIT